MHGSERSDAGEKTRAGTAFGKTANFIYEYCAHNFKKVTAVTGVTGKAIYTEAVTSVTSVTRKKYKTRYMITAPTFQKNAFMNIAPTFGEVVIKMNTAPT